jgi:hypothetical protein
MGAIDPWYRQLGCPSPYVSFRAVGGRAAADGSDFYVVGFGGILHLGVRCLPPPQCCWLRPRAPLPHVWAALPRSARRLGAHLPLSPSPSLPSLSLYGRPWYVSQFPF